MDLNIKINNIDLLLNNSLNDIDKELAKEWYIRDWKFSNWILRVKIWKEYKLLMYKNDKLNTIFDNYTFLMIWDRFDNNRSIAFTKAGENKNSIYNTWIKYWYISSNDDESDMIIIDYWYIYTDNFNGWIAVVKDEKWFFYINEKFDELFHWVRFYNAYNFTKNNKKAFIQTFDKPKEYKIIDINGNFIHTDIKNIHEPCYDYEYDRLYYHDWTIDQEYPNVLHLWQRYYV